MKIRLFACTTSLVLLLGVSACPTTPPGTPVAEQEQTERIAAGRDLYLSFCASCHGQGLRGDGPVADSLRTPPLDLTQIAVRRGGQFESAEVAAFIDGRNRLPAHGDRDMPVWGRRYDDRNAMMVDETRLSPGMIFTLVAYLKSAQAMP